MRIVFVTGILVILVIVITIIVVEGLITYKDPCHATVVYDFCVPIKMKKIDEISEPVNIVNLLEDVNNNKPFMYRQAFVLSLLQALLMTNFIYISFPFFRLYDFFYLFFMCFLFNSFLYAFVNFHYYNQKNKVMTQGLQKLRSLVKKVI
jgi:hypothetical protein